MCRFVGYTIYLDNNVIQVTWIEQWFMAVDQMYNRAVNRVLRRIEFTDLVIMASGISFLPVRHQAITWTSDALLSMGLF